MTHEPIAPATEPIPTAQRQPTWSEAFAVLKVANFRRFAGSYSVLVTSLTMQRIMLAWSVLEVSGSMLHVGLAISMQYLPVLLFGLPGGVAADRWGKRKILLCCQFAFFIVATVALVFAVTNMLSITAIYLFGIFIGIVQAFQQPAAQGIIGEIVPRKQLSSAVSFVSSAFQAGQVVGPALGGVLLAQLGPSWAWSINLAVISLSMLPLLRVNPSQMRVYQRPPEVKATALAGIQYLGRKPYLLVVLALIFVISVCVYATPVFLTAYAEGEFNIGAAGYGILNSIMAVGALFGALLSAKRAAPTLTIILLFTVALGLSQAVMGVTFGLVLFGVALFIRGAASLFTTTAANTYMQVRTNPLVRGRIMSFYGMVMNGGMALGNLIVGALVTTYGVRPVMVVTGLFPIAVAMIIWLHSRYTRR